MSTYCLMDTIVARHFGGAKVVRLDAHAGGVHVYQVTSSNGSVSTLIGSVHVGVIGLREPDMQALFQGASVYAVERVPGEGPVPKPRDLRYGMLIKGQLMPASPALPHPTTAQPLVCSAGAIKGIDGLLTGRRFDFFKAGERACAPGRPMRDCE